MMLEFFFGVTIPHLYLGPRAIISEEEISRDIVYPLEWHKTISTFIALAFAMMLNHMALSTAHDVVSRLLLHRRAFFIFFLRDK